MEVLHESRDGTQDHGDFGLMTSEEIKQNISMEEVLSRYGVKVGRNGMCKCPIHGEKHPSMKVYKDGYKCFACGSAGDIFRFVQDMEKCDFRQAFKILGGTYDAKDKNARINAKVRFERKKRIKQRAEQAEKDLRKYLMDAIDFCNYLKGNREPFSDEWCYAENKLPWLWHVYEVKYIEGEEVNEVDVFRAYREIRQKIITC